MSTAPGVQLQRKTISFFVSSGVAGLNINVVVLHKQFHDGIVAVHGEIELFFKLSTKWLSGAGPTLTYPRTHPSSSRTAIEHANKAHFYHLRHWHHSGSTPMPIDISNLAASPPWISSWKMFRLEFRSEERSLCRWRRTRRNILAFSMRTSSFCS